MLTDRTLEEIILDQREVFIAKDPGVKRSIEYDRYMRHDQIVIISGVRRCGKSTLQISYELNANDRDRKIAGLCQAMEAHALSHGTILTYNQEEEIITPDGMKIYVQPVWRWLIEGSGERSDNSSL